MKASDLFARIPECEGVEFVFGIPGEENLDLPDPISRSRIRLILTQHEQARRFMAASCGRLTGKSGVCRATSGLGATNRVTAAAYTQPDGMPMLMITGQKPIKTSKEGQFHPLSGLAHDSTSVMTCPWTSVNRRFRPLWYHVSCSWLKPSRCSTVA